MFGVAGLAGLAGLLVMAAALCRLTLYRDGSRCFLIWSNSECAGRRSLRRLASMRRAARQLLHGNTAFTARRRRRQVRRGVRSRRELHPAPQTTPAARHRPAAGDRLDFVADAQLQCRAGRSGPGARRSDSGRSAFPWRDPCGADGALQSPLRRFFAAREGDGLVQRPRSSGPGPAARILRRRGRRPVRLRSRLAGFRAAPRLAGQGRPSAG